MPQRQTEKAAIRERIWAALETAGASPAGAHGRIPTFVGDDTASDRLLALPAWQQAQTVKANPDHAQQPARAHALRAGKLLFMAVPKLAGAQPFFRLDPAALGNNPERVADRRQAAAAAPMVAVESLPPIDVVICGSVVVNYEGVRIGKGSGYSDIEVALLAEAGLLKPDTAIVTTVHELQVLDEPLPSRPHDFTVDYILTPDRLIRCESRHRPAGLDWHMLTPEVLRAIPVLQALAQRRTAK